MDIKSLEWSDQFSVDNKDLDLQHQQLFSLINELVQLEFGNSQKNRIKSALDSLMDYARRHFEDEEKILLECEYPEFIEHKNEHEEFRKVITRNYDEFLKGNESILEKTITYLTGWIIYHILKIDKKYRETIKHRKGNK